MESRRRHSVVLLLVVALAVSGCLSASPSDDGPDSTTISKSPITASEPDNDDEAEPSELHYVLEDSGIDVQTLDRNQTTLSITYQSNALSPGQRLEEIEAIATVYADYVANADDAARLTVTYLGPKEGAQGQFVVEQSWVVQFNRGELSKRQLLERIEESLVQGDPPDKS